MARADALLPNPIGETEKLRWLEDLDGQLLTELARLRGREAAQPAVYTEASELAVEEPWEELYLHWLQAKTLYFLGEYGRYQNAMSQFNSLYLSYLAAEIHGTRPRQSARLKY